ncbi:AMP-binding protein [Shimazuella sp. AN120528]|uniref:AMP-binding protein n=1 Tax=Shimazuella soli TaxID=1892854 RepID=UPI001F0E7B89|nr:AMP-binding protein [Shimazuella soli]MCH5584363.1 AMP-binding protein [Shimazuella soli]
MSETKHTYIPTSVKWEESNLYQFMAEQGFSSIDQLHRAIEKNPAWFWGEMEKAVGLTWHTPYTKVMDDSRGIAWTRWYTDGQTNVAYDAVDKHAGGLLASKDAIIWEADGGETRRLTYKQLSIETDQFAHGLLRLGVAKGDRIVIYLPMIPETVVAMMGAAKIGAIVIPVFSGYGADAVAARVEDSRAKVLITADCFYRRGKKVSMGKEAEKVVDKCPSLSHVIAVQRDSNEFITSNRQVEWITYQSLLAGTPSTSPLVWLESETPCMLLYTSGTTGKPKGTVHVHVGFPLKAAQDLKYAFHFQQEDTLCWVTDMGWMMGPWMVFGALLLGGSIVLYEGTADYPNCGRLWSLVAKHQITHLGVSPTAIRTLMSQGDHWVEGHDLTSLKVFGSSGEPWNKDPWIWLFEKVGKRRCSIVNYSGGTEISGGILSSFPGLPLQPCSFHGPIPGMIADVVDQEGLSVKNEVGELVIRQAWPGMTRGFWQNADRYEKSYWSRFPDTWLHGDWARTNEDGYWFIEGRSDDTLKVAGKRVGPIEYESALVSHEAVVEAATIGIPDKVKGTVAVCFVTLQKNVQATEELEEELKMVIIEKLGKPLKPKTIHVVSELPHTRNGKILRRVLRSAYLKEKLGDLSSLENIHAIEEIQSLL